MENSRKIFFLSLSITFFLLLMTPAITKIVHHCEHEHHYTEKVCKNHTGEHFHDASFDCDFCKHLAKISFEYVDPFYIIEKVTQYFDSLFIYMDLFLQNTSINFLNRGPPSI